MKDLMLSKEMREVIATLKQAGNPTGSISFENGVGNTRYEDHEICCILPLTGTYECVLQMVSKDEYMFYQAFPIITENKDVQINNLIIKGR